MKLRLSVLLLLAGAANAAAWLQFRGPGSAGLAATPEMKVIAHNTFSDDSDFNATPAISDGKIFLRSNRALYCIGQKP
jgi:hypothetical protein